MPQMPELPPISDYAAPLYVVFILLEIALISLKRARGIYETRDAVTSITMGLGSVIVPTLVGGLVIGGIYAVLFWFYQFAPYKWEFSIWSFLVCFILDDLKYYWSHRFRHTIRWGWASHVIHHSSQHYNLSTALRQPWFSFLNGMFFLAIPLVLLGFHPALIAFAGSVNLVYQFFIHTETVGKMHPWIEAVFNTPSHHSVHHGRNPRYLDSNYAGVLIIWDRMFGTFQEEVETPRYGLKRDFDSQNPLKVWFSELPELFRNLRDAKSAREVRMRLFGPPGWEPGE